MTDPWEKGGADGQERWKYLWIKPQENYIEKDVVFRHDTQDDSMEKSTTSVTGMILKPLTAAAQTLTAFGRYISSWGPSAAVHHVLHQILFKIQAANHPYHPMWGSRKGWGLGPSILSIKLCSALTEVFLWKILATQHLDHKISKNFILVRRPSQTNMIESITFFPTWLKTSL